MKYKSNNNVTYSCKYHVIFCPKYRRPVLVDGVDDYLKELIKETCDQLKVEIIEMEIMPDHVHLLLEIPPKMSVSYFMGYLKGKSSLMIFEKHTNLKYKFGNREFWATGYYVSTVGLNEATIRK